MFFFEKFTFIRILILCGIILYKSYNIFKTNDLNELNIVEKIKLFLICTFNFLTREGLSMALYFGTSFMLDTFFIFSNYINDYCETIKNITLYSVALITFIPNVLYSNYFKKFCFNQIFFILGSIFITIITFYIRYFIVFHLMFINLINYFKDYHILILVISIIIPPLVDFVQCLTLIYVHNIEEQNLYESENSEEELNLYDDESQMFSCF